MLIVGTVQQGEACRSMGRSHLALVPPAPLNGTVARLPPRRRPNAELRAREYLTEAEVEKLIAAAGANRYGHRDATLILLAYRHGLRAAELVSLRWDSVDFVHGRLHVARVKSGAPAVHPLTGRELRALRRLKREQRPVSPFVATTERGAPFSTAGFRQMLARAWAGGRLRVPGSPAHAAPCLRLCPRQQGDRHALAAGLLGHKNITHTVRYTELAPGRFRDFWED